MDKCKKCGYPLFPSDNVCERCGTLVIVNETKKREPVKNANKTRKVRKKNNKPLVLEPIFAFVISIILILGEMFLLKDGLPFVQKIEKNNEIKSKYEEALIKYEEKNYLDVIMLLQPVGDYKNSKEILREADYNVALEKYNSSEYDDAITYFSRSDGYKDASEQIQKIRYEMAETLFNSGNFEDAATQYKVVGDYLDAKEKEVISRKIQKYTTINETNYWEINTEEELQEIKEELKEYDIIKQECKEVSNIQESAVIENLRQGIDKYGPYVGSYECVEGRFTYNYEIRLTCDAKGYMAYEMSGSRDSMSIGNKWKNGEMRLKNEKYEDIYVALENNEYVRMSNDGIILMRKR
ncbi:hypothetical protein [Inconstantimicrobium porci]|uniref:hypothetical protein n=1 Tax=Inconstantimicrobium porci TaxID=2652291 RepID=UPI0024091835|nr:hypothetical protein [Inconstantimicrobium porci]MDD6771566.1 hypothetical protein [Inconstantimicrobium porci]